MSYIVMNPLLALLAPQTAASSELPVSATGSVGSNAISISGAGNAAVQVDSSSFLNILATSAYANGSGQDLISGLQSGAQGQLNQFGEAQLAELVQQLAQQNGIDDRQENILKQGEAGKGVSAIAAQPLINTNSSPQDGSGVNAAKLPTTASTSSIKTVAETLIGGEGGTSPVTVAPAPTSVAEASNSNSAVDDGQKASPVISNNIVRINNNFGGVKSLVSNDRKSAILTGSAKLLNQLEGVNNNAQTATTATDDPDILEAKGTLTQALKAYDKIGESNLAKPAVKAIASEIAGYSTVSSKTSTSEFTLNNITTVDSLRNSELTQAHKPVSTPAEQASIKIANALNKGIRHVTIQLEPAKLGQMEIRLELAQEGTSKLIVYVEKPETLNLMQKDSGILEKVLQDAGFKTDSGSLSFHLSGGQNTEGGTENLAGGNYDDGEMAQNDNLSPGIEYLMDLSNGIVDITV